MSNKAIILDRDGTVNVDKGYIYKIEDFELLDGVAQAIAKMNELGYKVIIITNQSGIARGYYTEKDLQILHSYMVEKLLTAGARIDAVYYCPHHPEASISQYRVDCNCRKPKTGLFRRAIAEFDINVGQSWAVGDRTRDIFPAIELGMRAALITSGNVKFENPGININIIDNPSGLIGLLCRK